MMIIRVFEINGLKQILRVIWTEKKTNEWILENAEVTPDFLQPLKDNWCYIWTLDSLDNGCQKMPRYLCEYWERHNLRTTPGQCKRGRRRTSWLRNSRPYSLGRSTVEIVRLLTSTSGDNGRVMQPTLGSRIDEDQKVVTDYNLLSHVTADCMYLWYIIARAYVFAVLVQ